MKKILLSFVLLVAISCDSNKKTTPSDSVFIDYIDSYTGGTVAANSEVKIRFTKNVEEQLPNPQDIFNISPAVKGQFKWDDNQTLSFQPDEKLKQNQEYTVQIALSSLFKNLEPDKKNFAFSFKTLKQNFDVTFEGVRFYDTADLSKTKINGSVQTADGVALEDVQKMIAAFQNNTPLEITWELGSLANSFDFSIENIKAKKVESTIKVKVDGSSIQVDKKLEENITIPSTGKFMVLSSKIVFGRENYISVLFSNPLKEKQNLEGYVSASGIKPRTVINQNELKLYLTKTSTQNIELTIKRFIQNHLGKTLNADYKKKFQVNYSKPEIRFLKRDKKAIMPSSNELILPFEAIGLKAVEVSVVKVFSDNVLQHLQVNSLGGTRELQRVARPISTKTVDLSNLGVTNFGVWNTFSLDLSDVIEVEAGALYQVKIGFNRKQVIFPCSEEGETEKLQQSTDWDSPEEESLSWDGYEDYYGNNYNWQQRDNPCNDSYYGDRRSIRKLFLASDLGVIAKKGDLGELTVFVTNLLTTTPMEDVEITLYNYQEQQIVSKQTDNEGKVVFDATSQKPFVLVAKKEAQTTYLKLDDFSSLSLSNFDITGTKIKKGIKGFIYGERGVWRPADTLHLTFILEDKIKTLSEKHPVIMELYDPNGQRVYRKINNNPIGKMYPFDFVTKKEALTGFWNVKARIGNTSFDKRIRIETVKPNRLKINLDTDKERLEFSDKELKANLNVKWLTGAKANRLKVAYEMKLTPAKTSFNGYSNFNFDDTSKSFFSSRMPVYEGRLDAEGNTQLSINLGDNSQAPGALNVLLFGKAFEEGGDFSVSQSKIPYYPYKSFVGLAIPEGDRRGMLLTDKKHAIKIASLNSKGNPISKRKIKVSLYKLQWRWWWDKSFESLSNYIGSSYRKANYTYFTSTTNGKGFSEIEVKHQDWGRYFIKVEDLESGHSSGAIAYFDWPGWAGKGKEGQLDGASILDFSMEKERFKVGEDISVSVPTTAGNRILVSVESGNRVLETFWVETQEARTQINLKARAEMAPNVYLHMTMIQPHNQVKNDLPLRLYGIQNISVEDPETKLKPKLKLPNVLRPEQKFTVEVSEENQKTMEYTIAVVDDGILDLTNFKTPDPWNTFFQREALSVKTWDLFDKVMGNFSTKNTFITGVGGDEELMDSKDEKSSNRFKPVAKFLGPFTLKAGGKNKHEIQMPQYVGSVRTMLIASSDKAYGNTEKTTPVKQEMMVLATLPRVIGPGEAMKLPVTIFALDDTIKEVSVSVSVSGNLNLTGDKTKNIRFTKSGDQLLYFDLIAKKTLGAGKVKVTATSGNKKATYDIDINSIPRNPLSTIIADEKILTEKENWQYDYQPMGIPGTNDGILEISTLPPLNLEQRLSYLINYPHGCIEQTTSAVFPQLYLDQLIPLTEERKNQIQTNIEAAIERIARYQISSGGLAYWIGGRNASEWGTNYAGHFLLEAKNAGYSVPDNLLKNWIAYQTKRASNWERNEQSSQGLIQAYRLYTLALAKKPKMGAMNRLKAESNISNAAKWRLASAYAKAGYKKQANNMISQLETTEPVATSYSNNVTFGSLIRDQAMVLETLIALEEETLAFEVLRQIATAMGEKKWMSTQTSAYALLAIAKYVQKNKLNNTLELTLKINGIEKKVVHSNEYLYQYRLETPEKDTRIEVSNKAAASVFLRYLKKGIPLEGTERDKQKNIAFEIDYIDSKGTILDISKLPKGTSFKAVVTITNPGKKGRYSDLALTQIFPSGWEIINTRMQNGVEKIPRLNYLDIRDDRVMHYFDLNPNREIVFTVLLNASYEGTYYLPGVRVEAMYDNSIYANQSGRWIQVVPEN